MLSRNLFISGGKIELIDPIFINVDALFIKNKCDSIQKDDNEWSKNYDGECTLIFNKKYDKKINYLEVVANKVNIINNDAINELHVNGNFIKLNKKFILDYCSIDGNEVSIGDVKESDTIISVNYPSIHIKARNKLELKNCTIVANENIAIHSTKHLSMVEPSNIKIENCTIKSKRITFGEKICYLDKTSTYNTTMEFKKSLEKILIRKI